MYSLCESFLNPTDVFPFQATPEELTHTIQLSREAYQIWRDVPGPKRGEVLRQIREALASKVRCSRKNASILILPYTLI